jgi:hypothetical protein
VGTTVWSFCFMDGLVVSFGCWRRLLFSRVMVLTIELLLLLLLLLGMVRGVRWDRNR